MTGQQFTGQHRWGWQEALTLLYNRVFGNGKDQSATKPDTRPAPDLELGDTELLEKSRTADNGAKF